MIGGGGRGRLGNKEMTSVLLSPGSRFSLDCFFQWSASLQASWLQDVGTYE